MGEIVSVAGDGAAAARRALERTVSTGGVVLFPADGLYGLGCDPLNRRAIEAIHALKGRPDDKPSAVMYFSVGAMRELLSSLGPRSREALGALLPGPLTLVVANPEHRYPLACGADPGRLGIRLIEGPLAGAACPLFQTSANRSGEPASASFDALDPALVAGADLAIDGGRLAGLPSTVVDVSGLEQGEDARILREGAVPAPQVLRRLEALDEARK